MPETTSTLMTTTLLRDRSTADTEATLARPQLANGELTQAQATRRQTAQKSAAIKILAVEDNIADYELILGELRRGGFEVSAELVRTAEEFRARLRNNRPDVVLADYHLGEWQGMEAIKMLREEGLDVPAILMSGALGDETAVECIKQGATDYVLKDSLARLSTAIRRALQEKELAEEHRRSQDELTQKVAELARSNQDLEQFAYASSHDLQEPLRMITTYVQLLEERYKGKLDGEADKYIHYAVDGAARMRTLIQDLLAFSRSGQPRMETGPVDVDAIIERTLDNLSVAIQESGAVVTTGPLSTTWANATQLQQVFQNLIGNAIKFHGLDPVVIHISAEAAWRNALFPCKTTGSGLLSRTRIWCFRFSSACILARSIPAMESGCRSARKSSSAMEERYGWSRKREEARSYASVYPITKNSPPRTRAPSARPQLRRWHDAGFCHRDSAGRRQPSGPRSHQRRTGKKSLRPSDSSRSRWRRGPDVPPHQEQFRCNEAAQPGATRSQSSP